MKKHITLALALIAILFFAQTSPAATFTSKAAGPNAWNASGSWDMVGTDADGIPDGDDDVTIAVGHTINISVTQYARDIVINGTLKWIASATLLVIGNYTVSATGAENNTGVAYCQVQINSANKIITVLGTSSATLGYTINANQTIAANSVIDKSSALLQLNGNAILTNLGTLTTSSINAFSGSGFVNGSGGVLTIKNTGFMSGRTFTASAVPNTVNLAYTTAAVPTTTSGYYNLTLNGAAGTKTLPANTIVANNLTINASNVLNSNGFDLTVGGNWVNNGTFTQGSRTVKFNGTSTISGSTQTTFYNIIITGTVTGHATNMYVSRDWTNNGTFNHNNGRVTFNGTTVMSGSAPSNFYNISLAGALTAPSNLGVASGWINNGTFTHNNGTVTFNGTTTLSGSSANSFNHITITGSFTPAASSNINVAGNWANNGTFTHNSGTVTFNGNSTISGSATTTFRNVTISGALTGHASNMNVLANWVNNGTFTHNSGTVTFTGTTALSGSSTNSFNHITISGSLTPAASSNINVAGNWTNNGVFTHNNASVTFNGTSLMSGSATTSFRSIVITGSLTGPSSSNFNVSNNWTNNGAYTGNNGTVTFNGTSTVDGSATTAFHNVTISGTLTGHATNMAVLGNWLNNGTFIHNNGTITFNGATAVTGSTTSNFHNVIIGGTLTGHSTSMDVSGDWTNNGAYTHNSGTVVFNGTSSTISGSSTTTFNNISISGTLTGHSSNMNITGNWINDGTFNANNGTVSFTSSSTVSGSSTTTFQNVTVSGTLSGHATNMNISGDFTNDGTYDSNSGTLTFNGSTPQSISGSGTATYEGFTLNNGNGLSVNNGIHILTGVLTLTAGTLTKSAGSFTLLSDASRYARIAEIDASCTTCGFSGDFNIERYIPSRTIGTWADLSSPVSNATMGDWDNELFMVYPFIGFDNITNRPTGSNVMAYDEPSASYVECNASTILNPTQGFEIGLTDDENTTSFAATTLSTIGTPNYGTFDIPLNFTAANGPAYPIGYTGENLIGNPFASAVDLSLITITNALPTVDVYDYNTDNYKTLSGTDLIGPHQGFWVYAQSNGASVTIPELAKSSNTSTAINRVIASDKPYLHLTIASADGSHTMQHTLQVACDEHALDGWDVKDHPFRKSLNTKAPSITSNAGEAIVTINTFNNNHETYIMPLNVHVGENGKYKITTSGIQNISKDYTVVLLEDKMTQTFTNLNHTGDYTFNARTSDSKDRFVLHFSKSSSYKPVSSAYTTDFANQVEISQTIEGNTVRFDMPETTNTTISIMDLLGKNILENMTVEASNQSVTIALPADFRGMYLILVQSAQGKIVKKFTTVK